jgi:hypothetical protein
MSYVLSRLRFPDERSLVPRGRAVVRVEIKPGSRDQHASMGWLIDGRDTRN